ncbi:MAG TPA: diguanylate cyclase [Anaeromyxobacteraceae bacterium]
MPHLLRSRIGRKLLVAVGLPTLLLALAGVAWLRAETHAFAPGLWAAVLAFLLAFAAATALLLLLAVRLLVEQPLARIVRSLRRAEAGDFLLRVPIESEDELGELARSFNTALAAITDLRWRRLEDARSMESMERELALKAQVEAQALQLDAANRGLETRLRELTLLAELAHTMSSTLRLEQLLHAITALVGALGHEAFALLLLDERAGDLVVSSGAGLAAQVSGTRLPLGQGVAGLAARDRQLVLVPDTRLEPRFPVQLWAGGEHGSLLAVPMVAQDACVGVLDFFRPSANAFPEDEIRFLESVAGQAALTIANARLHERTVALAITDPLTGVPNRRGFFQRLEMELERSRRFGHGCAVAMVDVDRFQALNEARGRVAGDATLCAVAELLSGALRKVDTLARQGGEEFAVLLPRATRAAGLEAAEKLRALVAAASLEHGAGQPSGRVTVSIGVAAFPEDAEDLAALLDCADAALFAAKKAGRDKAVAFAPGMRDSPGRRRDVRVTGAI